MIAIDYLSLPAVFPKVLDKCDRPSLNQMLATCKVFNQFILNAKLLQELNIERLKQFNLINFLGTINFKLVKIHTYHNFIISDKQAKIEGNSDLKKILNVEDLESSLESLVDLSQDAIDALADVSKDDFATVVTQLPEYMLADYVNVEILEKAQKKVRGLLFPIDFRMMVQGCACVAKSLFDTQSSTCFTPYKHGLHPSLAVIINSNKFEKSIEEQLPITLFYGIKEEGLLTFSDSRYTYQLKCIGKYLGGKFENFMMKNLGIPEFPAGISAKNELLHKKMFEEASKKYADSIGLVHCKQSPFL